ncbi:hypothetical protein [Bacillus atrophaeus]|uniref:hypothetical protein n=1 Tax=Bacillus atrophaeus TaxID=1452 RepID=UPI00227EFA54|nr:hypothetical protein [Bacillus atrophaeus]MCY8890390.1 hypothetical protein [Bacillus spizizenii]MEC0841845.1 hypothetical protein [Bacillus spizizenii]MED1125265.1 hypothetical protein [Bacillus atrophaeus]
MSYDFERIGKEKVLNDLLSKIKGKGDYLKTKNLTKNDKLQTLKDIEGLSKDAHKILSEL